MPVLLAAGQAVSDQDEILKPAEAAKLLRVSRSFVYEKAADGTLPSFRIGEGGPLRFWRADLLALVQAPSGP